MRWFHLPTLFQVVTLGQLQRPLRCADPMPEFPPLPQRMLSACTQEASRHQKGGVKRVKCLLSPFGVTNTGSGAGVPSGAVGVCVKPSPGGVLCPPEGAQHKGPREGGSEGPKHSGERKAFFGRHKPHRFLKQFGERLRLRTAVVGVPGSR